MGDKACFPKWLIKIEGESPFKNSEEGIYCYSDKEKEVNISLLKKRSILYTLKEVKSQSNIESKTKGIKYNNRSEVLRHIENDETPESLIIPKLLERLHKAEQKELELEQRIVLAEEKAEKAMKDVRESKLQK